MKRKTSTNPSRIYAYGARPPRDPDITRDVLYTARLVQKYWNHLCWIRGWQRRSEAKAVDKVHQGHWARYMRLINIAINLRDLKRSGATKEARQPLWEEEKAVRTQQREERKVIYRAKARVASLKREILGNLPPTKRKITVEDLRGFNLSGIEIDALLIELEQSRLLAVLRKRKMLPSGTYGLCDQAFSAASTERGKHGLDPLRRRRWSRVRIGAHFTGGVAWEEVVSRGGAGCSPIPPPDPGLTARQASRRAHGAMTVQVATPAGGFRYVSVQYLMHRPLPDGAMVKDMWISVDGTGPEPRYEAMFSIDVPAESVAKPHGEGTVAMDLGWRNMGDRIRVAYCIDQFGKHSEIAIPIEMGRVTGFVPRIERAEGLRSVRDGLLNAVLSELWDRRDDPRLPDWFAKRTEHVKQWRSPERVYALSRRLAAHYDCRERLYSLWVAWREQRLQSGADLFAEFNEADNWLDTHDVHALVWWLYLWQQKDKHLHRCEWGSRRHALNYRDEVFTQRSRELSQKYQTAIIEGDFDLRAFCVEHEEETSEDQRKRAARVKAAPGKFREILVRYFASVKQEEQKQSKSKSKSSPAASSGGEVQPQKSKNTTKECHCCGGVSEFIDEERRRLILTCHHCGASWDQDVNACLVMLKREGFSLPPCTVGSRKSQVAAE